MHGEVRVMSGTVLLSRVLVTQSRVRSCVGVVMLCRVRYGKGEAMFSNVMHWQGKVMFR